MDDRVFLLSAEEYERCRRRIPFICTNWWLRDPGAHYGVARIVAFEGIVDRYGIPVDDLCVAIRPALKIDNMPDLKIVDRISKYCFPWIVIDDGLAIAEVPVSFGVYDGESSDYESSVVRQFLLGWYSKRL